MTSSEGALKRVRVDEYSMNPARRIHTGWEFVPGAVQGLRGWDVDSYGRLYSLSFRYVWTPGENVSECKERYSCTDLRHCSSGHGFYGFHNHKQSFKSGEIGYARVYGVIRGYGKTVVGTKGFRSEKAEIVALYASPWQFKWRWFFMSTRRNDYTRFWFGRLRTIKRLRELYPGVKIYRFKWWMLRQYPPTPEIAELVAAASRGNPETDDDFWTKEIVR